ncbi:hypothetical protein CYMTET_49844 [Cymbomonas tetramitiformis]|uniref:Uncharacterized protein n=1 Tax=Cymbomonas tetramitiformis TaxID=36881 RepID=A0AAE0BPD4_9CHLO|nr:hypothetical protein CYMTET_49844 [Cymbomonas tetramitiformis]
MTPLVFSDVTTDPRSPVIYCKYLSFYHGTHLFAGLHAFEAHLMTVSIANKQQYAPTGISPFEFRYARAPGTVLTSEIGEQPLSTLDPEAPTPQVVNIKDRLALSHAIRQAATTHQSKYQDRYDGKNNGKAPTLQLGDAVLLRRSGPDRSAITTSKLLGFANTGPFVIEEFVGKSSARLRDPLWGTSMPTTVKLERLSLFRRRDSTPIPQFEEILRTQDKPKLDAAYETREKRLQESKADLASRPDAPVCTSCKKNVDRLHAKYMCKPCYTKLANSRAKAKRVAAEPAEPSRPRGRPRKRALE